MTTIVEGLDLGSKKFWDRLTHAPAELAAEVCTINLVAMDTTLQQHPALRAWVHATYETARIEEERLKWELTKARNQAYLIAKSTMDPDTGKAKTVNTLEAEKEAAPIVQAAMEAYLHHLEKKGALRALTVALEDRKDMLIQLAAKHRAEQADYRT